MDALLGKKEDLLKLTVTSKQAEAVNRTKIQNALATLLAESIRLESVDAVTELVKERNIDDLKWFKHESIPIFQSLRKLVSNEAMKMLTHPVETRIAKTSSAGKCRMVSPSTVLSREMRGLAELDSEQTYSEQQEEEFQPAVNYAAECGSAACLKTLLQHGAEPLAKGRPVGRTAVLDSIRMNHIACLTTICDFMKTTKTGDNSFMMDCDNNGRYAIHYAARLYEGKEGKAVRTKQVTLFKYVVETLAQCHPEQINFQTGHGLTMIASSTRTTRRSGSMPAIPMHRERRKSVQVKAQTLAMDVLLRQSEMPKSLGINEKEAINVLLGAGIENLPLKPKPKEKDPDDEVSKYDILDAQESGLLCFNNSYESKRATALHLCCWRGFADGVRILLDRGADIESVDMYGDTPLLASAFLGPSKNDMTCAEVLLENGANAAHIGESGETLIHILSRCGHTQYICDLLDGKKTLKNFDIKEYLHQKDGMGATLALRAAQNGSMALVKKLCQLDKSLLSECSHDNRNLFHFVCAGKSNSSERIQLLQWILDEFGGPPNAGREDSQMSLPTNLSTLQLKTEAVGTEAAAATDASESQAPAGSAENESGEEAMGAAQPTDEAEAPDSKPENEDLHVSIPVADPDTGPKTMPAPMLKRSQSRLMPEGASMITCEDDQGWMPLCHAAAAGNTKLFDIILVYMEEMGISVADFVDPHGRTLLHIANIYGKNEIVMSWAKNVDADECPIDKYGNTPLHYAIAAAAPDAASTLISINQRWAYVTNKSGMTPLQLTARVWHTASSTDFIKKLFSAVEESRSEHPGIDIIKNEPEAVTISVKDYNPVTDLLEAIRISVREGHEKAACELMVFAVQLDIFFEDSEEILARYKEILHLGVRLGMGEFVPLAIEYAEARIVCGKLEKKFLLDLLWTSVSNPRATATEVILPRICFIRDVWNKAKEKLKITDQSKGFLLSVCGVDVSCESDIPFKAFDDVSILGDLVPVYKSMKGASNVSVGVLLQRRGGMQSPPMVKNCNLIHRRLVEAVSVSYGPNVEEVHSYIGSNGSTLYHESARRGYDVALRSLMELCPPTVGVLKSLSDFGETVLLAVGQNYCDCGCTLCGIDSCCRCNWCMYCYSEDTPNNAPGNDRVEKHLSLYGGRLYKEGHFQAFEHILQFCDKGSLLSTPQDDEAREEHEQTCAEIVNEMVDYDKTTIVKTINGETPRAAGSTSLHLALRAGHSEFGMRVAELLVSRYEERGTILDMVTLQDVKGRSCIHELARMGYDNLMLQLIPMIFRNQRNSLVVKDNDGFTPIMLALTRCRDIGIRIFLNDPHTSCFVSQEEGTLIHVVIRLCHDIGVNDDLLSIVDFLSEHRDRRTKGTVDDINPFHLAVKLRQYECMQIFLQSHLRSPWIDGIVPAVSTLHKTRDKNRQTYGGAEDRDDGVLLHDPDMLRDLLEYKEGLQLVGDMNLLLSLDKPIAPDNKLVLEVILENNWMDQFETVIKIIVNGLMMPGIVGMKTLNGDPMITRSIFLGRTEFLNRIMENKELFMNANLQDKNAEGYTALHAAIKSNNCDLAENILDLAKKNDVLFKIENMTNNSGENVLYEAIRKNYPRVVGKIMGHTTAQSVSKLDAMGGLLQEAMRLGDASCACALALLRNSTPANYDINKPDKDGIPPLVKAIQLCNKDVVTILVGTEGINMDSKATTSNSDRAFILAIENPESTACASLLLDVHMKNPAKKPMDCLTPSTAGYTPLQLIAKYNNASLMKAILSIDGIDLNAKDPDALSPLMRAQVAGLDDPNLVERDEKNEIIERETDVAEILLTMALSKKITDLDVNQLDCYGMTPLTRSILLGQPRVMRLLLRLPNLDIMFQTSDGRTPLECCLTHPTSSYLDMLLDAAALQEWKACNVTVLEDSRPFFHCIVDRGWAKSWPQLLALCGYDTDLSVIDPKSQEPILLHAAHNDDPSYVEALLEFCVADPSGHFCNLDVNITDKDNNTLLAIAIEKREPHVVEMLLKFPVVDFSVKNAGTGEHIYNRMVHHCLDGSDEERKNSKTVARYVMENVIKRKAEKGKKDMRYGLITSENSNDGSSPFVTVVENNMLDLVRLTVKHDEVDVNCGVLLSSVSAKRYEVVGTLLEHPKIDVNDSKSVEGAAPIVVAAKNTDARMMGMLVQKAKKVADTKYKLQVNIKDNQRQSALVYAIQERHLDTISRLLECPGVSLHNIVGKENALNMWRAMNNMPESMDRLFWDVIKVILECSIETKQELVIDNRDCNGDTLLQASVKAQRKDVMALLLKFDSVDIAAADANGKSALLCSIESGDQEMAVKILGGLREKDPGYDLYQEQVDNTSMFFAAINLGWERAVNEMLMFTNIRLNDVDKNGRTPFMLAVELDLKKIAHDILKGALSMNRGLDLNLFDEHGNTLYYCILSNEEDMLKTVFQFEECNPVKVCPDGRSAVYAAVEHGRLNSLKFLAKCSLGSTPAANLIDVNLINETTRVSPLHVAVQKSSEKSIEALLTFANINVNVHDDIDGFTPLIYAVHLDVVDLAAAICHALITRSDGAIDVNRECNNKKSAIEYAIELGRDELVSVLFQQADLRIKTALDVAIKLWLTENDSSCTSVVLTKAMETKKSMEMNTADPDTGKTPIFHAIDKGADEIIDQLLRIPDCNLNVQESSEGLTPLMYSVVYNPNVARHFFSRRTGDLKVTDHNGRTVLHHICNKPQCGPKERELLEMVFERYGREININGTDNIKGYTALHVAASRGHAGFIQNLLQFSHINVNVQDHDGRTALHVAVAVKHNETIITLVKYRGIDMSVLSDADGCTPLQLALRDPSHEMLGSILYTINRHKLKPSFNTPDAQGDSLVHNIIKRTEWDVSHRDSLLNTLINAVSNIRMFDPNTCDHEGVSTMLLLILYNVWGGAMKFLKEFNRSIHFNCLYKGSGAHHLVFDKKKPTYNFHFATQLLHVMRDQAVKMKQVDNTINDRDENGFAVLHLLAMYSKDEPQRENAIQLALTFPDVDVNIMDSDGNTPMHLALGNTNQSISHKILSDSNVNLTVKNHAGDNPLHLLVKRCIGKDFDSPVFVFADQFLCEAIQVIEHFAPSIDLNAFDLDGKSPLCICLDGDLLPLANRLLEFESINLNCIQEERNGEVAAFHVGYDLNISGKSNYAWDCLMRMLRQAKLNDMKLFDVNQENREGKSILYRAVEASDVTLVNILLLFDSLELRCSCEMCLEERRPPRISTTSNSEDEELVSLTREPKILSRKERYGKCDGPAMLAYRRNEIPIIRSILNEALNRKLKFDINERAFADFNGRISFVNPLLFVVTRDQPEMLELILRFPEIDLTTLGRNTVIYTIEQHKKVKHEWNDDGTSRVKTCATMLVEHACKLDCPSGVLGLDERELLTTVIECNISSSVGIALRHAIDSSGIGNDEPDNEAETVDNSRQPSKRGGRDSDEDFSSVPAKLRRTSTYPAPFVQADRKLAFEFNEESILLLFDFCCRLPNDNCYNEVRQTLEERTNLIPDTLWLEPRLGSSSVLYATQANLCDDLNRMLSTGEDKASSSAKDGPTALQLALENNHKECAEILLKHGADLLGIDTKGDTALHYAARRLRDERDPSYIYMIIDQIQQNTMDDWAIVNSVNNEGRSALFDVIVPVLTKETRKAIELLVENGMSINTRDNAGRRPLHEAARAGNLDMCKLFVKYGAHFHESVVDHEGRTVIHDAALSGNLGLLEYFVDNLGASVSVRDINGLAPIDYTTSVSEEIGDMTAFICQFLRKTMIKPRLPASVRITYCNLCEENHKWCTRHSSKKIKSHVDMISAHINKCFPGAKTVLHPMYDPETGMRNVAQSIPLGSFELEWMDDTTGETMMIYSSAKEQRLPTKKEVARNIARVLLDLNSKYRPVSHDEDDVVSVAEENENTGRKKHQMLQRASTARLSIAQPSPRAAGLLQKNTQDWSNTDVLAFLESGVPTLSEPLLATVRKSKIAGKDLVNIVSRGEWARLPGLGQDHRAGITQALQVIMSAQGQRLVIVQRKSKRATAEYTDSVGVIINVGTTEYANEMTEAMEETSHNWRVFMDLIGVHKTHDIKGDYSREEINVKMREVPLLFNHQSTTIDPTAQCRVKESDHSKPTIVVAKSADEVEPLPTANLLVVVLCGETVELGDGPDRQVYFAVKDSDLTKPQTMIPMSEMTTRVKSQGFAYAKHILMICNNIPYKGKQVHLANPDPRQGVEERKLFGRGQYSEAQRAALEQSLLRRYLSRQALCIIGCRRLEPYANEGADLDLFESTRVAATGQAYRGGLEWTTAITVMKWVQETLKDTHDVHGGLLCEYDDGRVIVAGHRLRTDTTDVDGK